MPDAIADRRSSAVADQLDRLAARLGGDLLRPGDDGYDEARRVFNAMVDRRPAAIVRCASPEDVAAAIDHARSTETPVVVRGGGHSIAGRSIADDALLIDLSPMNVVEIDPETRIARVGPGAVGADLDAATQAHGLATTSGTYSTTGVIGLTLGGGMGFLARRYGLAVDNLVAAEIVLADGSRIRATDDEHSDLLWALRGGGGSFGVVTSIELRLHPVGPEVAVCQAFYPWSEARQVLRAFRDLAVDLPDEVGAYALAVNVPPIPDFPEESHGGMAVAIIAGHCGAAEEGERVLQPLTELGSPLLSVLTPMPYAVLQTSFDAAVPEHERYFWKTSYLSSMSDEVIDAFVAGAEPLPGPFSSAYFELSGGAIGRVDPTATAFPHRDAPYNLGISAGWSDPASDEAAIGWARAFADAMAAYSTGGMYVNYLGADDLDRARAAFGPNHDRLREVKDRYDPDGVFNGPVSSHRPG